MKRVSVIWAVFLMSVAVAAQQPVKDSLPADTARRGSNRVLKEVTVSAGSFDASDKAKGASLTPMDAVTVAGSNADITQALRSLPGAQQIGEQEGLFVRGGTSDETRQFIDGTLLKYPNYPAVPGIQQFARINPFLFKGILFSAGGYSALYGQAMSSALIMESIDLPDKSSASFSVFPSNLGAGYQHLARNGRSSYGVGMTYSHQGWYNAIVPHNPDYFSGPSYFEGNANFRIKTGRTGMLKYYTMWTSSDVGIRNPDIDSTTLLAGYQVKGKNYYGNLSYRNTWNSDWRLDAGLAYSYNDNDTRRSLTNAESKPVILATDPYRYKNGNDVVKSDFAQARVVITRFFPRGQALRIGAEHFYSKDHGVMRDSIIRLTDQLSAAFAEGDIRLATNVSLRAGVRAEYSSLLQRGVVAPRAGIAWRLNEEGQLNLAYGIFFQEPQNTFLYHNTGLDYTKATHYVLNYTRRANNRYFRLEAYYKKYDQLIKTFPQTGNNGNGYAQGVELFYRDKKTFRNLDYWITYTYLDTKRDFMNYPYEMRPTFAAPHTTTIAIKKFFQDLSLYVNLSYSLAAGRPYYDLRYDMAAGHWRTYDEGTTKAYSVANIHVAYITSFFKNRQHRDISGVACGVNNLLGTAQVFGYNYSAGGANKVAITLPATRTYFIGVFISLGTDRTSDILDNL
ncbi:TonB-dependent receptor plug domain-containing protein [Chitinophaga solisilvae]|uniref:TonB-dependent receptor plug domain-containing protein n=1 Tax=Chitinophaga solisilvae TaxID=1233460 RepID=UPI00136870A8|nr:TonB-dependent receptor [Chitinophaga solisilvae]